MEKYIRLDEIKLGLKESENNLGPIIQDLLDIVNKKDFSYRIVKKSIDSRDKGNIIFIYSVDVSFGNLSIDLSARHLSRHRARYVDRFQYNIDIVKASTNRKQPIIIGCGPAGLFSGLALAKAGLKPIIIERGKDVDNRIKDVDNFLKTRILNTESNIQFGEGGAGTFSDGKLYTMINDPRSKFVFEELIEAGAPPEIEYSAKAHVGTDILRILVKNLRNKIIKLGGEIRFSSKMTDIKIVDGKIKSVLLNDNQNIETNDLILAIGHSARDTYEMIYEKGIEMIQKPFAIGLRIEHDARMINESQFGYYNSNNPKLGTASYKMVSHSKNTRSVYTFCMCPGGHVVSAASEEGKLCINGMSEYNQDSGISNSALLVNVNPEDFSSDHPLAGIDFQRKWEQKAFILGGSDYNAPAQLVGDFLNNISSTKFGNLRTTYKPGVKLTNLNECLPDFVSTAIRNALPDFNRKIIGFSSYDSILLGIEARSSSVVRILRDKESLESNIAGIYPCGEGAGYAGGITSSAIDGLIISEKIISKYLK